MALVGVELETLVSEPDALITRPLPCAMRRKQLMKNCYRKTYRHLSEYM